MKWYGLIILAGIVGAVQNAINPRLGKSLGHPAFAALASFTIGMLCVAVYCLLSHPRVPTAEAIRSAPWWAWLGGLCGAIYVVSVIVSVPKTGVGAMVGLSVTCSLIASLMFDHFGWLGLDRQPITPAKVVGSLLLIAGVWLIMIRK